MRTKTFGTKLIIAGTLAIFIGLLVLGFQFLITKSNGNSLPVCTMEALQCPDGSYVGRQGQQCTFAVCPNQTSFKGMLRQGVNGFELILPAPENGGMEVSYVMPLVLGASSDVTGSVGKLVEVFGHFTSANTLSVEKIETLKASDPTVGELRVGKTAYINGVKVTLEKIIQDSRCPVDVTCIRAGNVTLEVTLQSNTDTEKKTIISDDPPILFDSYQISIVKILPEPHSKVERHPADYVITLKVRSN
ncbi:MAG: hypothetical protein V4437_00840 [Patescibacteria group bacterium]